jgi:hypothetical protein
MRKRTALYLRVSKGEQATANQRRARPCMKRAEEAMDTKDPGPSAQPKEDIHDAERITRELLQELDEEHRRMFLLVDVDGRSIEDVAVELGIPENTGRARLKDARMAFAAAAERRREDEVRRTGISHSMFTPAVLLNALRTVPGLGSEAEARVWSRLERILGPDILDEECPDE